MTASPAESAPLRAALLAQLGGLAAVGLLVWLLNRLASAEFAQIPLLLALMQGGIAAAISRKQRAPPWWVPIHLFFVPLAVLVQRAHIAPVWFLAGFVLLLLVFWRTDKSRVPLYLTNRRTAEALAAQLPQSSCRVLDLGCGDAGLLRRLAKTRPDCQFVGIEYAPLPWLAARLRTLGLANACIRHGDLWQETLGGYDLVYAFLSPAPMPRLWGKVRSEMAPRALFVSNSFAVPGIAPDTVIAVEDWRATRLYIYRLDKAGDSAAFPDIPWHPDRQ